MGFVWKYIRMTTEEFKNWISTRPSKNVSKFVAKQLKYSTLFEDKLTFLGPDYRNDSLITLYLFVIGISISKIR